MRDLEATLRSELHHATGQQSQPLTALSLIARLEEQLVPEADAEHGAPSPRELTYRTGKSRLLQRMGSDREGAHARKHHTVACHDHIRIRTDHRLSPRNAKRALHAAKIADAVIANPDSCAHSVPFVDGTPPPMTWNASREARPSALNAASAM